MLRLIPVRAPALRSRPRRLRIGRRGGGIDDRPDRDPAAEPLRVGLITDLGQLDDNGFNELAFKGLKRAESELGIKGRVIESAPPPTTSRT